MFAETASALATDAFRMNLKDLIQLTLLNIESGLIYESAKKYKSQVMELQYRLDT